MPDKKLVQLEIADLASDGRSVGHLNGKVVFCDGGLPGETVLAEIVRSRPRYSQAIVHEVVRASDARITPVCSHFGLCGGCAWQDLTYDHQLDYKKRQVVACLERLAVLGSVDVADAVGSPDLFHYRNKMEFSFHATPDGGFTLGLHRRGRFDEIFDLHECHLQSQLSNRLVDRVRRFVADEGISVYDVRRHIGFMRFLVIREGKRTGQVLVNIVTNYGDIPAGQRLVASLTGEFPEVTTIVHNQNGQKSNVATGEVESVLYGPGCIEEEIGGLRFRIEAGTFFQTNTAQAETLFTTASRLLAAEPGDRLLDLYCGTGTIGMLLAGQVREAVGVELVGEAVELARRNAAANSIANITFIHGSVKDVLASGAVGQESYNIVVVDPPRAGLHRKALAGILALAPAKLLYISCNPATFARDARLIADAGYRLPRVVPVDMFPHTKHIELVALFYRR
ncbi:MAG TPA: 23S rRNA (uracil(1939)-C(5))-methyltransferase RlmD [Acidobacteriota bacterium]|nr:23S rRNA (uracil(1939)-C(5))-methyltransferase RlmD [Acidobacteriota bacterium]